MKVIPSFMCGIQHDSFTACDTWATISVIGKSSAVLEIKISSPSTHEQRRPEKESTNASEIIRDTCCNPR